MSDVDSEFWKIVDAEGDRRVPEEPAPGPGLGALTDLLRFCRDEIDSPAAPPGARAHDTHEPYVDDDSGESHCLRCCVRLDARVHLVTVNAARECPGKRTMVTGDDGRTRWVSIPEGD